MLNMIKMDLYRMFRTKSMYVIWIILAVLLFFTTYLTVATYEEEQIYLPKEQTYEAEAPEQTAFSMTVTLPTEFGYKVTVYDIFYSNMQAKFVALFLLIFSVIFSTADIKSGYIKNIGGQVRNRGNLIISKAVVLVVFSIVTILGVIVLQAISNQVFLGYLEWGDLKDFASYTGVQIVLHCALVLVIMAIAVILKSNVWSIVIAVCLCFNVMTVLYSAIDILIHKIGIKEFQLSKYTVTGNIFSLSTNPSFKEYLAALVVGIIYLAAMLFIGSYVFKKRDI